MLKVTVNEKSFEIEDNKGAIQLNGESFHWDLLEGSDDKFHIIKDNRSFTAEIVQANFEQKSFQVKINNQLFDLQAKDRFDLLLEELGMSNINDQKINDLKAPMPGLILDILVNIGDEVAKGDKLLILEAMKMENIIKASGEGKIKDIVIEKGNNVEKNQVLIVFE